MFLLMREYLMFHLISPLCRPHDLGFIWEVFALQNRGNLSRLHAVKLGDGMLEFLQ